MNPAGSTEVAPDTTARIRSAFSERLVPLAVHGLARMLCSDQPLFCFRAVRGSDGELRLEGHSERYSAMAAVGLLRLAALGADQSGQSAGARSHADAAASAARIPLGPVIDRLAEWAVDTEWLGDAGLVLWLLLLAEDDRAELLLRRIAAREQYAFTPGKACSSMDLGLLLIGLAEAVERGTLRDVAAGLASRAAERLAQNQNAGSDLFSFGRKVVRKNLLRARVDGMLGSFASQVYPTMALARHARATGSLAARDAAARCARRLCALQGDEGQWWWVYHTGRGHVTVRYPVYSVHQDAMGPMALCAAALADGRTERYDAAVLKSLDWFENRPECRAEPLIDGPLGVVWRGVQHDDPGDTDRLGLGRGELWRMAAAAWLGFVDRRPLDRGHVCMECRPYHLGWILLAASLFEECAAGR